jgi:hypothetical protein
MLLIAAGAHLRGEPFALWKDLDGSDDQRCLDVGVGEAVGQ